MSGPAYSHEPMPRRAQRLALGVSIAFVVSQLAGWPLAQFTPVFAVLLLTDAEPLPVRRALRLILTFIAAVVGGYLIARLLLPYPAVLVLVAGLLLYRSNVFALTSGAHVLGIVGMVLGCIVVPVMVKMLPLVAVVASLGFFLDLLVAMLTAWVAFLLIPAPLAPTDPHRHGPVDAATARVLATRMTLVVIPMLIAFLLFGWTSILVLVYSVLIAMALSDEASFAMGWDKVIANLLIGGVGMVVFYEMLVAAPSIPIMAVLAFGAFYLYGTRIFAGGASGGLWVSGFIGFLILAGGAMLTDDVNSPMKVIDRVVQISIAGLYVVFAYRVIDLVRSLIRRSQARGLSPSNPEKA